MFSVLGLGLGLALLATWFLEAWKLCCFGYRFCSSCWAFDGRPGCLQLNSFPAVCQVLGAIPVSEPNNWILRQLRVAFQKSSKGELVP